MVDTVYKLPVAMKSPVLSLSASPRLPGWWRSWAATRASDPVRGDAVRKRLGVAMHGGACAALAGSLLLSGCAGGAPVPPERGPGTLVTPAFRHASEASAAFDARWWEVFDDATLAALVSEAQHGNLDLRIAAERVQQARAGSTAAASRLAPGVSLNASASDERSGLPQEVKRGQPDVRALRAGLDLGWEVDLFGAARAAADAAELDAQAAAEGAEGARLLAAGEAARLYLVWQGARARLERLQALLQTQAETERLTRSRAAEGVASRFDVARAAAETQSLAAQLPPLRTLVATTGHQIAVLLGRNPGRPLALLDGAGPPALPAVPALAPGQPVQLLARRPDLRAAERQLAAEGARLREARADLLPKLFLGAVLGRQDLRINGLDLAPVGLRSVALAFTAPLFNAGRLRAAQERASSRERAAALAYERAALAALQEVESALVALAQERERAALLDALVRERRAALDHARALRREGQIDLLQLLDVQRGLIAAELAHVEHRTQLALDAVQLYRALGGAWQVADPGTAAASSATPSL
ncbi:efflux transporter outer membrane subunit [Azohydromonas aeria]|uniref:efflux transporter outer membrane subunit n=1 Tax=Azohydromonas aeria TaxID=2590212 RepID=UPI002873372E|nr:efflux transporter outer membrane subunit [Azohydromonas aeria]